MIFIDWGSQVRSYFIFMLVFSSFIFCGFGCFCFFCFLGLWYFFPYIILLIKGILINLRFYIEWRQCVELYLIKLRIWCLPLLKKRAMEWLKLLGPFNCPTEVLIVNDLSLLTVPNLLKAIYLVLFLAREGLKKKIKGRKSTCNLELLRIR